VVEHKLSRFKVSDPALRREKEKCSSAATDPIPITFLHSSRASNTASCEKGELCQVREQESNSHSKKMLEIKCHFLL
jgi:hypothetical protein